MKSFQWLGTKGDLMRVSIDGGEEQLVTREEMDRLRAELEAPQEVKAPRVVQAPETPITTAQMEAPPVTTAKPGPRKPR